jgi:transcriptional regulator with PAS, ATPase and Fis domain
MEEGIIKISESSKTQKRFDELLGKTGQTPSELINNLINKYEFCEEKLDRILEEYKMFKIKEMDVMSVTDSITDGIYVTDKNGIVVSINRAYTAIAGVKEEEIIGRHLQQVWDEKHFDSNNVFILLESDQDMKAIEMIDSYNKMSMKPTNPRPVCTMVLEKKKEVSVLTSIERNNKIVLMTGKPFFDDDGNIVRVVTILRDLTELLKLKEKLDQAEIEKKKYLSELKHIKKNQQQGNLLSKSTSMEMIKDLIRSVAKTDATILITGETGVGKEVIAREIYRNSSRSKGPYVKINCAAIPESLLESELFGYEKGAFTGAQSKEKLGLFEIAHNGTILLDEIGEMPMKLQTKLLRVLQEREIKRIGGVNPIKIDVRVIAATNQNLSEQIKKGEFREDLFYRLNVIPINISALRERREDISLLACSFLDKFNKKYNKSKELEMAAIQILEGYSWPGNVRELENVVERLTIIGDETFINKEKIINILGKENVPSTFVSNDENYNLKEALENVERQIIEKALKKYKSTYKAAEVLGITQSTVFRKAKAYGIL